MIYKQPTLSSNLYELVKQCNAVQGKQWNPDLILCKKVDFGPAAHNLAQQKKVNEQAAYEAQGCTTSD